MTEKFVNLKPETKPDRHLYNSCLLTATSQKDEATFFTDFANDHIDSFLLQMQRSEEAERALRTTIAFSRKEIQHAPTPFYKFFLTKARRYIRIAVVDRMFECDPEEMQLCYDYIVGAGLGNGYVSGVNVEMSGQYNCDGLLFLFHADASVWQYPASMCLELLFYLENAFVGMDDDTQQDKVIFVLPDAPNGAPANYCKNVITATTIRMQSIVPEAKFQFIEEHNLPDIEPCTEEMPTL